MFDIRQFAAVSPEWYLRLQYHEELGSTNDEARRVAEEGAEHGTVVLADHQLSGRGRRGSSWISDPGDGLLFSIILQPEFPKNCWSRIALATGLGIVTALNEKWDVQAEVKWPNDVYIRGRKCAGILAEARENFVIVGVGINVVAAPEQEISIAVSDVVPSTVSREKVLVAILNGILSETEICAEGFDDQMVRLREVCYLTGKTIHFTVSGEAQSGKVCGLGDDGSLLVDTDGHEGIVAYAQAAEIRVTE